MESVAVTPRMVLTPTTRKNLDNLTTALNSSTAVLIQGEVGSGKSASVHALAHQREAVDTMLQVNVDDSFDSKDLLGKFSATEVPGVFEWVPGPLTIAVQNGYWILMEDIDLASFDVFSVLQSLLENGTLFIADKNKIVKAHPQFKLIATQQLYSSGATLLARKSNSVPYAELWGTVILANLPAEEQCDVVRSLFPNVPVSTAKNMASLVPKDRCAPLLSLRSLLKWAARVSRRLASSRSLGMGKGSTGLSGDADMFLPSTLRETMLQEAYDCVVAKFPPGAERTNSLALVAEACGVPENVAIPLVLEAKPMEKLHAHQYSIGRIDLPLMSLQSGLTRDSRIAFAPTAHAMSLLERLAAAVESKENVLLTGETGVGKTFIVQYLADQLGQTLVVHNLNQQTDTSDFMGGWKPLDVGTAVRELYTTFNDLFSQCFNAEKNVAFLNALQNAVSSRNWDRALRQILKGCETFKLKNSKSPFDESAQEQWRDVEQKAGEVFETVSNARTNFAFTYEEGSLVKAWREGHWILLDELNLASTDVLERVSSVLGDVDKLFLTDKGDAEPIPKHPNFHVFANMNPPTDVGKKDLPPSLRSRFTECYVSEPFNESDIRIVVKEYVGFLTPDAKVDQIAHFFLDCVENAKSKLCALDGESKPPSFSLRTLTRALSYVRKATPLYGYTVSLFDGLLLGFATPLQRQFHAVVEDLIVKNIFNGKRPQKPTLPQSPLSGKHIAYEHMWIGAGGQEPFIDPSFILTESVKGHLTNLSRAVFANRPVLLEGPTSSGKSSMVKYLAELTGNRFVRINNHDSTEVQEYLGSYVTDELGKLRFVDGILVNAVRHGYWVVLDELNLAPTDVLEALNRLLDDNCELFIPDTQETIKPHPSLRIFATQNPAGIYGGRKMLSRAFRNRFLEITVDEIPTGEVSTILRERYALPESFAEKMVEVMTALQIRRQSSQIFAGRHGFITPRDLFRWAERKPSTYQELAEHGFLLLGERCRKASERQVVKDVIETATKAELNEAELYSPEHWPFVKRYFETVGSGLIDEYKIVWTESMQRLFTVVGICLEHQEPVLLVGETGSSKTTVCQLWAALLQIPLRIVNCHQHTEAADFLGSLRPVPPDRRDRALFEWRNGPLVQSMLDGDFFVLDEVSLTEDSVLERLNSVLEPSRSITLAEKSSGDVIVAHEQFRVMATMNPGGDFGKKELSPALRNRFTEVYVRPTTALEEVTLIVSKRLDPELREWAVRMAGVLCGVAELTAGSGAPQHISIRDVISWVSFMNAAKARCPAPVAFLQGLDAVILDGIGVGTGQSEASAESLRRVCVAKAREACPDAEELADRPFWSFFAGMAEPTLPPGMENRFFFGAPATRRNLSKLMRASIVRKAVLLEGSPGVGKTSIVEALGLALGKEVVRINLSEQTDIMDLLGSYLPRPADAVGGEGNADIEGDAGAVTDARSSPARSGDEAEVEGQAERTADDEADEQAGDGEASLSHGGAAELPSKGPQFAWSDGVLLRALKEGSWVILDELNLASQSVLEGLNALLDHRSTVFIPELNKEFHAHEAFRVFACQNPVVEGGGRKGLPRSFLNRFMRVRVEAFATDDLISIATAVCHGIAPDTLTRMVRFVGDLQAEVMTRRRFGTRGSPWEFNLRDVLRWAKAMAVYDEPGNPTFFADTFFLQRMRTQEDRQQCLELLARHFDGPLDISPAQDSDFLISDDGADVYFQRRRLAARETAAAGCGESSGLSLVSPTAPPQLLLLPSQAAAVRSLLMCATLNQLALLVGPSGSGKTFALHAAAALAGAQLVTFSMNASCDTVDLLGGFDQVEGRQGEFEWRDSLILEAMLQGHWLVLDNVNYCNASVLDRLNPLVEPNGVLSVNEQGLVHNEVRVVRPHPRFRLFATLNPRYGEISRAMRNRAVEICLAPVAVPSPEAGALCVTRAGEAAEAEVDGLATFHRRFVGEAFGGADTACPAAAPLSDALAAGAPNVFTLLRASTMVGGQGRGPVGEGEGESEDGAGSTVADRLTHTLEHCYLDNRSGHWRHKMAHLRAVLQEVVESATAGESRAAPVHATPAALLAAVTLRGAAAVATAGAGDTASLSDLVETLARARVLRAGLPLLTCQAHPVERAPALGDVLLHFLLEQIRDSTPSRAVDTARRQLLSATLPADRIDELVGLCYTDPALLGRLYCRASLVVGPHAGLLEAMTHRSPHLSDSALVNDALAALRERLHTALISIDSPARMHRLIAPLATFVCTLGLPVTHENYIAITAHARVLHSVAVQDVRRLHTPAAEAVVEGFAAFFEALRRYLSLPFSLVEGGRPALHKGIAQLRVTSAEERAVLATWQGVARTAAAHEEAAAEGGDDVAVVAAGPTEERLLLRLWRTDAFRVEFTAVQCLLSARLAATDAMAMRDPPADAEGGEEGDRLESSGSGGWRDTAAVLPATPHGLLALREAVARVLARLSSRTTSPSPATSSHSSGRSAVRIAGELGGVLWHQVAAVDAVTAAEVLGQCTPLLLTRFAMRAGLQGVVHLFPGSWTDAAAACLAYAGGVPALAIGQRGGSGHTRVLDGLSAFLAQCPVASRMPVAGWEANARHELHRILHGCVPGTVVGPTGVLTEAALRAAIAALAVSPAVAAVLRDQVALLVRIAALAAPRGGTTATAAVGAGVAVEEEEEGGATTVFTLAALLWALKARLLLPLSPVDPMFQRAAEVAAFEGECALLQRLEEAFGWADAVMLRTGSAPRGLLATLRADLAARAAVVRAAHIPRPDDGTGQRYARLVGQLHQLCADHLSDARLAVMLFPEAAVAGEGGESPEAAHQRLLACDSWSELVFDQVVEILREYGGYEDVTLHVAESALLAAMAVKALCFTARDGEAEARAGATLFSHAHTLALMQFPTRELSLPVPSTALAACARRTAGHGPQLRNVLTYLDACLASLRATVPQSVDRGFVEDVFAAYRELYRTVELLEERERAEAAAQVLYKEKTVTIEGDDEVLLRRLRELFPSYDADFADDGAVDTSLGADRAAKHARLLLKESDGVYVRRLVEAHGSFYRRLVAGGLDVSHVTGRRLVEAFRSRFDTLAGELHRFQRARGATGARVARVLTVFSEAGEDAEHLLLSGFATRAALLRQQQEAPSGATAATAALLEAAGAAAGDRESSVAVTLQDRKRSGFNIYYDADPGELARFSRPLGQLLAAVQSLADRYPDTVSLQRCLRIGHKIAALPALTTPLMKVVTGCEILLRECYEWERNAASAVSLMSHMTELSAFVLRWRRLELHCWQHVFKARRDEYELRASLAWFSFYDFLRGHREGTEEHEDSDAEDETDRLARQCRELFHRLSRHLWDGCYGDFSARLQLVRNLACELVATHGAQHPLTTTVLHVADFFGQFEDHVRAAAEAAVRPIEEDVEEFAKIMRWEDANYYAVRATSEKAHLRVARALGELENVLRTPVLPVISAEEQRCVEDLALGFTDAELGIVPAKTRRPKGSGKAQRGKGTATEGVSGAKRLRSGKQVDALSPPAGGSGRRGARGKDSDSDEDEDEAAARRARQLPWQVQDLAEAYAFFDDSARAIVQRVKALQAPKTPQQVKVRALRTFFDAMIDFGVRHTHETHSQPWEVLFASTEALLASRATDAGLTDPVDNISSAPRRPRASAAVGVAAAPATTPASSSVVSAEEGLAKAAEQHYRFARWLQRMREAERKPHADLSAAQVKRATGMAENLFTGSVTVTELVCGVRAVRAEMAAMDAFVAGCHTIESESSGDGEALSDADASRTAREALLHDALKLCCTVHAVHASLEWMAAQRVTPAESEAGARADFVGAIRSARSHVADDCHALLQLCSRYEPLRRRGRSLPVAAAAAVVRACEVLRASCERLAGCGDAPAVVAAARSCARQASDLLSAHTARSEAVEVAETERKRRRTEHDRCASSSLTAGEWEARVAAVLGALVVDFSSDAGVVVDGASPLSSSIAATAAAKGTADSMDDAEASDASVGDDTRPYARVVRRLEALRAGTRRCREDLQHLLSCAPPALPPLAHRSLHRQLALATAALADAEQTLVATLAAQGGFGVVVTRLFTVLLTKGFCKAEDEDPEDGDGDGDGGGGLQSGTGMDDGEGERDVTNEIENEDQLMNMKDKEKEEEEDGAQKDQQEEGDGEDDKEDNAADVETDFQARKEAREESEPDEGSGDEDGSDQEMGSVDGEDAQERKKMRKDKSDANDMDEDDGGDAEDVPEDEFGNEREEELNDDEENGPETGGFDNKDEQIREADRERDGEHELAGLDDDSMASDGDGHESGSDSGEDDGYTSASESVSQKAADTEEDEAGEADSNLEGSDDEREDRDTDDGAEGGSEGREDDSASTDSARSAAGEDEDERAVGDDGPDGDDSVSGSDGADVDGKDENVFEGGFQDEQTGEEATEKQRDPREDDTRPKASQQPDTTGNEEEQAGDEQEQDEAGRNWKKQQEQNEAAQRRKDNTDERTRAEKHNPYRAIKEALKRHQRQVQQLNLNQQVDIKKSDDAERERDSKVKDDDCDDDDDEKGGKEDVAEFDFDTSGDREGMAATDEMNQDENSFAPPTATEQEGGPDSDVDGSGEEESEEEESTAPEDRRRRRDPNHADLTTIKEEEEEDDDNAKSRSKAKRDGSSVKVTARRAGEAEPTSSDEDSESDPDAVDEAGTSADAKLERGRKLWQEQETAVQGLSQQLCEQLRLILAPTLADKLQGDYKTGKRLNMKRIIPYIASQFKKDRIWLRRTKPNKRTYQIMVALDDSLSMQCNEAGTLSCRAVALIAKALQQLEVGEIGIACFGKETNIVHGLEEAFVADSGPRAFSQITFQQTSTNMKLFLETTLDYLDSARERASSQTRSTTQQLQQVLFVLSDGQITEDRAELRKLLVRAEENHQMVVFVLLDIRAGVDGGRPSTASAGGSAMAPAAPAPPSLTAQDLKGLSAAERMRRLKADRESRLKRVQSNSILDMQIVEFKQGKVVRRSYMEDFPFPYYLIVRELQNLPEIIADAMRQWFELLNAGQ